MALINYISPDLMANAAIHIAPIAIAEKIDIRRYRKNLLLTFFDTTMIAPIDSDERNNNMIIYQIPVWGTLQPARQRLVAGSLLGRSYFHL